MKNEYAPIMSMKEVPDNLRKLQRRYLRYQQAELVYSISHKKLLEFASEAGAIYRMDGTDYFKYLFAENRRQKQGEGGENAMKPG